MSRLEVIRAALARRPAGWLLAGVIIIGAVTRLYRIDTTWFFLEQAQAVSAAAGIAAGTHWPLLGLPIGWTTAHAGPLYFYLISLPFLVARDPVAAVVFAVLLNLMAIVFLYAFARAFLGPAIALVAALLYAVSPLAVFSSRILWNPGLMPVFTVLFIWSLHALVVNGRSAAIVGVAASLGVLVQLHSTGVALVIVALLAGLLFRPRVAPRLVLAAGAAFLLLHGPLLVYELTHGFANARALARALVSPEATQGPIGYPALIANVVLLCHPVLDGLAAGTPLPGLLRGALWGVGAVEAGLFALGIAGCAVDAVRPAAAGVPGLRRRAVLLLLWLAVPIALLGSRRHAVWWYYLDVLYPCQFLLAALALARLGALAGQLGVPRRAMLGGAGAFLVVLVTCQLAWQASVQRATAARGEIVIDTARVTVGTGRSPLGELRSLPYAHRRGLVRLLLDELGADREAFARRIHGVTLGVREETAYLLDWLAGTAARSPTGPTGSRYLVIDDRARLDPARVIRARRYGPYVAAEYAPALDYARWGYAIKASPTGERESSIGFTPISLPAEPVDLRLPPGAALLLQGPVRWGKGNVERLAVSVMADAPLVVRAWSEGSPPLDVTSDAGFTPSLYVVTEALLSRPGPPADAPTYIAVTGPARIRRIDVYEVGLDARLRGRHEASGSRGAAT